MQAYFLTTGEGKSLEKGPTAIVFDKNNPDSPEVINGRSCMSCHFSGMNGFEEKVRPALESVATAAFDRNKALAIYPKQDKLNGFLKQDSDRFAAAIHSSGGEISVDFRTEPIHALSVKYSAELSLELAAAETGLTATDFSGRVRSNKQLLDRSLGQLLAPYGGVKRDLWEQLFKEVVTGVADGSTRFETLAMTAPSIEPSAQRRTTYSAPASGPRMNPKDGLRYVLIPAGSFQMGCSPGDSECYDNEKPSKRVTLTRSYLLGETEVTQAAYERVTSKNPSHFKGANQPVESVSWHEAKSYCDAIGGRLPTEAEWEYAARGEVSQSRYGDVDALGWYDKNSQNTTHRVGEKKPNRFGLYDILGNVWEWTADWYGKDIPGGTDPKGPTNGDYKILRGGSWFSSSMRLRASIRIGYESSERYNYLGFRCVWE